MLELNLFSLKILQKISGLLNNNVGRNFGYLVILQGVNFILPLVTMPYLVRVLGSDKFGLVMFAQSFAVFFNVLVDFGFNLSATREIAVNKNNSTVVAEIFSSVLLIKGSLLILSFLVLLGLTFTVPNLKNESMVFLLSFGVVFGQAIFPIWYFQGIEKMQFVTITNVLAKVLFTILIFALIKEKSDYLLVPIFNTIGFVVAGIIGLVIALRSVKLVGPNWLKTKLRFKESFQLFISNLSVTLYTVSNTVILGFFTNNTLVGVYASFEKLILAVKNIYGPLFQAMFPWLSKKKEKEMGEITQKMILPLFGLGLSIFLVIYFAGDYILEVIYADEIISSYSNVFRLLGLIAVFSALNMLFNTLFLSVRKKYHERMLIMIVTGVLNLILGIGLVQSYDIWGIAITVTFSEFILLVFGGFYFYKFKNE